ncbi:MAG TPA: 30S ribosomal protein S12 methylthiotransferase RimO [Elusimicrobiales bacterium]|nr:30S ribosomal protein S12 methylthiotransferase RimO [Elusimicrobiales bacterium]
MRKLFIVSLGCPKNLTDAEVMAGRLAGAGFELTGDPEDADLALINTCAFLGSAVKESETEIKRLLDMKKRGRTLKVAVTGCLVERKKELLLRRFPQLDFIAGINALDSIASAVENGTRSLIPGTAPLAGSGTKVRLTAGHTAYLKVADGCGNHCAYCLIPSIRGPFRSKPVEAAAEEARALASSGAKEISLIAQDTTSYGADLYGRPKLYELLRELVRVPGIEWLRLMYVHPEKLSSRILRLIRDENKICRYLDMPVQHISDKVLRMMNRRSTERSIRGTIAAIRKAVPDMALRTNLIAGFPGESDEDFEKLIAFVKETEFDNIGIFAYSREPGTSAAGLPGQLPERVKKERMEALIEAQSRVVDRRNASLKGAVVKVLMDSPRFGRTFREAPEIDGGVEISGGGSGRGKALRAGDFAEVRITGAAGYLRRGTPIG